jgi:hypothetical protein
MAILGLRGTGDFGADERPKSFRETILWREPNGEAPLTALMSKMRKGSLTDPEHSWWEEDLEVTRLQLNDGTDMTSGDTAVVVDAGAYNLVPNDLLMVEKESAETTAYTAEIVKVVSISSDTAFVISRGYGGTTAAAILDDTFFLKIGSVFAEGTNSPTSSVRNPTKIHNFAQIWKTAYELTETTKKTKFRTGDPMKQDKIRKMFDHSVGMELSALFGVRSETTGANGKPERSMGGLLYMLQQYAGTAGFKRYTTAVTYNTLLDDIYQVFDYSIRGAGSGNERLVLVGNGALNEINKLATASGQVQFKEVISLYGMALTKLVLPQGTLYLKTHPLMNRHPVFTNSAFIINPPGLNWKALRDTKSHDNIQAPDADTEKGQWLTEGLIEFNHLKTFKYLGNISST